MITADSLPFAPRWLGELMYPGGAPVLSDSHRFEGKSVKELFHDLCSDGNLSDDEIMFLKQYIVYFVNAPLFDSEFTDELRTELNLNMHVYEMIDLCLDYGLDPF